MNKTITYEYDKNGNKTKMTDPEGGITLYGYNPLNLIRKIINPNGKVFDFTYDELGRRSGLTYPNGINTTYTYDPASNLTGIVSITPELATVNTNTYTYDNIGNRLTNTDIIGVRTYEYDATYQLTRANQPTTANETYTYDKAGNRETEARGLITYDYTHTRGNRIQTRSGETYTHDKNGNITKVISSQGTTTYEYDYDNRLKKATMTSGTIAEYKYDPLGRRIEKTVNGVVTRYLYDGFNILAEYDENNTMKTRYTHNIGIDDPLAMERNNNTYYYHKDALGSITTITDQQADIVQSYQYDAFGNITSKMSQTFIQPFTFTGREYDPETGLYYYRMRYYSPTIGRFISEDPIGFGGGDANIYRYVGNSPANFIDSLGMHNTTLRDNINRSPSTGASATSQYNTGRLIQQIGQYLAWRAAINAMNDAEDAIFELQKTLPYDQKTSYEIVIIYGSAPYRFIGLAKAHEDLMLAPDWFVWHTRIQGLKGLPMLSVDTPVSCTIPKRSK